MYLQIIRLEGAGKIRLSNITLYDIKGNVIKIPDNAVQLQSSLDENPGFEIITKGTENGWWEIDLLKLIEIARIKVSNTNIGKVICMNSEREVLFTEIRDGYFSFEYFTDYTIHLPHTYQLSKIFSTGCLKGINGEGTVYNYQSCTSSDPLACPPLYNNKLPITVDPIEGKYGLIDSKNCKTLGTFDLINSTEWSECDGTHKSREWEICPGFTNCPNTKKLFTETQDCKNGELIWSQWTECDNNKRTRIATCVEPINGGKPCPNVPYTQTENCSNVLLSEWGPWSSCDKGVVTRTRTCIDGVNSLCKDKVLVMTQQCTDGRLTEWSEWSKCEDNTQKRTRKCIEPINGGKVCSNEILEQEQKCADGKLTEWSEWSKCDGSNSYRTRECIQQVGHANPCPTEPLRESIKCTNTWSECNLNFEQFDQYNNKRNCTPMPVFFSSFCMLLILIIVLLLFQNNFSKKLR